jgi:hypothetical protein
MADYLPLPDGTFYPIQEGTSPQEAWRAAKQKYPEAFVTKAAEAVPPPKKGLMADIGRGAESLVSSARTAYGALTGSPEEAAQAALERGEAISRKYEAPGGLEAVKKAYAERGILPAAGEALSQIPGAIAEQAPNIAATLGAARLGAMAGAPLGPVGAVIGGGLGAAVPSLMSQFGGNIQRQAAEQRAAGQPVKIDVGAAGAAAVPQAALDVAGTFIPLGGKLVTKLTGIPTAALFGRTAEQASKLADERLLAVLAKGTATGALAEIPTEIAQQMLERAQAGLSLSSEDALKEYGETAYQVGLLAPIGAVGRLSERGGARQEVVDRVLAERIKEQQAAAQLAEAKAPGTPAAVEAQLGLAAPEKLLALPAPEEGAAPTAVPTPEVPPRAAQEPMVQPPAVIIPPAPQYNLTQLMEAHDTLKQEGSALEDQMQAAVKARDQATLTPLLEQHGALQTKLGELNTLIEQLGGTTTTLDNINTRIQAATEQHTKALGTIDTQINKANGDGDFSKANTLLTKRNEAQATFDKTQQDLLKQRTSIEQKTQAAQTRGTTPELFTPAEAPVPKAEVEDVTPPAIPGMATKKEEVTPVKPAKPSPNAAQLADVEKRIAAKNAELPAIINSGDKVALASAVESITRLEQRKSRLSAGEVTPTALIPEEERVEGYGMKPVSEMKPFKLISGSAPETGQLDIFSEENLRRTPKTTDELAIEDKRAAEAKVGGRSVGQYVSDMEKRRVDAFLSDRLNLAGTKVTRTATPEEYDAVMNAIAVQKRAIENPQKNAKRSVLQELFDLAKVHEAMQQQPESKRRNNAMENLLKRYNMLLDTKVKPAREEIVRLHQSLYKAEPAAKAETIKAERAAEEERLARAPKVMSKAAATAARINKGDVRKEAEASEKMRTLAKELGREEPPYMAWLREQQKRLRALEARYGKEDDRIADFRNLMRTEMDIKAVSLGKTTPEYKATLKEQIEYFKETLGTGKQEVKSKREGAVTRKVSAAPSEFRTSSPEGLAKSNERIQRLGQIKRDFEEARASEREGGDTDFASEMRDDTNSTLLNDDAIFAVREGNILKAVDAIAKNGSSALVRELAAKLKPFLDGVKISVNPNVKYKGESVAGLYKADTNAIEMHPMWLTEEDVLHEMAHAATMQILSKPSAQLTPAQREAVANLNTMFNALNENKDFTGEYALKDIKEFVAEVYSNQQLRNKLDAMGKPVSAWRRFKEFFARLIGFTPEQSQSKKLLADIDKIMSLAQVLSTDTLASPKRTKYANDGLAAAGEIGDKVIAKNKTFYDKVKAHSVGLAWETALVDRFAGFERLSKVMDPLKGTQMMYYLRMYDQRMNFVSQAVGSGALRMVEKTRADGRKEYVIESKEGPSLKGVVQILKDAPAGSPEAANRLFTLYLAALRAKNKGFESLHMGDLLKPEDLAEAVKAIEATPGLKANFDKARNEYNEYNRGLVDFLAQTGAISKELSAKLLKENDYIPFYRPRNGNAELIIGNENPIRIGNIAAQPYLQELIGSGKPILDFMISSVQNTNMLTDMALRNIATKNAVFELVNLGLAKIGKGDTAAGTNVVKFKVDGEDRFAIIDTDTAGIPADILVKGMEGIPTQMPFVFRILGAPAQLLRKAVTLSPLYAARQLFRDSLAAPILAGADFMPVIGALKEIGSGAKKTLESRGITGGQIFTGGQEDLTKILRDISAGKDSKFTFTSLLSKAESLNMAADALTRRAQYNSYIKQGLSEMEATLMSLESMNFNKRGSDPSIHILNSIIPFFNAQIQGLNVLYKAARGQMPFNERLKIQEKMLTKGLLLAGGTLAYAFMMEDDEAYKNATPEQKYGNWFVRFPGMDEPFKFPVPFEIGYIFKALPEALYNTLTTEHGGEEAVKALKAIIKQTIPGGSSYGIPQALKPAIEAGLGKSFYTGRDILSKHEQMVLPEYQFRENTTEIAKTIGKVAGVSPIVLEQLVSGYTGTMGLAFLQAISTGIPSGTTPEKAYKRMSETPVIGGLFQSNDAGNIINETYERMNEFKQVKTTVDDLIKKGNKAEAMQLLQERGNEYAGAQMADKYVAAMRQLTQYEQAVRASDATPEKKREQLDSIRQMKIRVSATVRGAADKTIPR